MDSKEAIEIIKILQDFYSTNEFTDVPNYDIAFSSIKKIVWDWSD